MTRSFAIALVLLVAAQAAAIAQERMVCRYTGRVMQNCPCPERSVRPTLEQLSCCTMVRSDAAPVAAREKLPVAASGLDAAPPVVAEIVVVPPRAEPVERETPPPYGRRYLRLQQLLI